MTRTPSGATDCSRQQFWRARERDSFLYGVLRPRRKESRPWRLFIRVAAGWTCIKRPWPPGVLVCQGDDWKHKQVRTFGTWTQDLQRLADWLSEQGVTHLAMEATGVYWK